jgi:hypothetical protein
MLRMWLAALPALALCAQAFSVRGQRGGDVLAAGAPALAPSSASPATICGLPSVLYTDVDLPHTGEVLGEGGFGMTFVVRRNLHGNEALPLERRALANADDTLALKVARPNPDSPDMGGDDARQS